MTGSWTVMTKLMRRTVTAPPPPPLYLILPLMRVPSGVTGKIFVLPWPGDNFATFIFYLYLLSFFT